MKDTLVVNAPASGAESLTFLKTFIVVPLTIITTVLYLSLRKNKTFEQTFNRIIGSFFVFFLLFMIAYPYTGGGSGANYLHMNVDSIREIQGRYPSIAHLIPLLGNWTYSLFYAASELWGTFVLSILFWQFANDIIGTSDSKRFYPLMILSGNIGVLAVGLSLYSITQMQLGDAFNMYFTCISVLVLCLIIMASFYWMQRRVLIHDKFLPADKKAKKQKLKLGLMDSFKKVFQSPYIGYIAILVLCYGILINVVEVTWKQQLKRYSGDSVEMVYTNKQGEKSSIRSLYQQNVNDYYGDASKWLSSYTNQADFNANNADIKKVVNSDVSLIIKVLKAIKSGKVTKSLTSYDYVGKEDDQKLYQQYQTQFGADVDKLIHEINLDVVTIAQIQEDIYNADQLDKVVKRKEAQITANNALIKEDQDAVNVMKAKESLTDAEKNKLSRHESEIVSKQAENDSLNEQIAIVKKHINDGFKDLSKEDQNAQLQSSKDKLQALLTISSSNDNLIKTVLVEASYFNQVKALQKTKYLENMSLYTIVTGCVSICFIYASKGIIRKAGWLFSAAITPIMILFTGILFFLFNIFPGTMTTLFSLNQTALLFWSVCAGGFGILVSKCAKYSFFDPTKEMAFIPLEHSERTAGKAAADGVGGRLGKSGGSLIQASLLFVTSLFTGVTTKQTDILPYLSVVLIVMGVAWLYSVGALSKLYNALVAKRAQEEAEANAKS